MFLKPTPLGLLLALVSFVSAQEASSSGNSDFKLTFLDRMEMTDLLRLRVNGVTGKGPIGLGHKPGTNLYYFLLHGPETLEYPHSWVYPTRIPTNDTGFQRAELLPQSVRPLQDNSGAFYTFNAIFPTSLEYDWNAETLYWTNQQNEQGVSSLREMGMDGRLIREIPTPIYHLPDAQGEAQTKGVRPGLGYKGLTFHPDGKTLAVVSQGPLMQDGDLPTHDIAAPVRITIYDVFLGQDKTPEPVGEFIYMLGPIPQGYDEIAVVDNVAPTNVDGLYLETYRNTTTGQFMSKLFVLQAAQNILGMESVRGEVEAGRVVPVGKKEVLTLSEETLGFPLDRLDYMVFGETLSDGRKTLHIGSNSEAANGAFQYLLFVLEN